MNEVRFHSRKGNGAIKAAQLLASAFRFGGRDGGWRIPPGWEHGVNFEAAVAFSESYRGNSVSSLVIFYPPLLEVPDVWMGFERPDVVLVNTRSSPEGEVLRMKVGLATVDATEIVGSAGVCCGLPGLAAPMLGAYAAVTGSVLGSHLIEALEEYALATRMGRKELQTVLRALEMGYDNARIHTGMRAFHCGDPEVETLLWAS